MDAESLKKWAEELQKRERFLQEREKELESKIKKQLLGDGPGPPMPLGHSTSSTNLMSMSKEEMKASGQAPEPKKVFSQRYKTQGSRKPFRLQPLSEKNKLDDSSSMNVSVNISQQMQQSAPTQHHSMSAIKEGHAGKGLSYSKNKNRSVKNLALQEAVSDKKVADALSGEYCLISTNTRSHATRMTCRNNHHHAALRYCVKVFICITLLPSSQPLSPTLHHIFLMLACKQRLSVIHVDEPDYPDDFPTTTRL